MDVNVASPLFQIEDFSVIYPGATPLSHLNLTIRRHEITCLLGKSGCGKTTLLKALGGFTAGSTAGDILFDGQPLTGPNRNSVMIFQENNLYPWLTVKGNVAFGLRFSAPELSRQERDNRVLAMLETVGLSDSSRRFPHQLSGGMRQRTAIARALVADPEVLLLDEPFSALDISLRRRMQGLLKQLWQETRMSMVMVTHNIEEAMTVGQRIIVLGGQPATILLEQDTDAEHFSDRYSTEFLHLQQQIESIIY